MGLRKRLGGVFWPPDEDGEQRDLGAPPQPPAAAPTAPPKRAEARTGLGRRLKNVGVREELREGTGHFPAPAWAGAESGRNRAGLSLKRRLQQVGVPDVDAQELARQQRILDASREAESRARREAAHALASSTCPLPIHPERIPLPGGLSLRDDEFLVISSRGANAGPRDLTLTTRRLVYTRGRNADAQLVVYLADICDVVFHADDTITVGTPSGRWDRIHAAGNDVVASRDRLLALIDHARAQRAVLPGGLDELVELRDRGAITGEQYESRRAVAAAAPRRRRRQVEVSGRATPRTKAAAATSVEAAAPPAPAESGAPAESEPAQPDGQSS
jgi:hypothetical protein